MDIFVDWGSSNFRAFLMKGAEVVERREVAGQGILKSFSAIPAAARIEEYSWFLFQSLGNWLSRYPDAAILMCGAIGSREGWVEADYAEVPVSFRHLAQKARRLKREESGRIRSRRMYILPGAAVAYGDGTCDVMRSEEVKALGAAARLEMENALLCIPGTHSKWVEVKGERIVSFHTVMTGEIYQLMSENGALSALFRAAPAQQDNEAFDQGIELAEAGGDLLADLWQVRSQKLRALRPPQLQSFFSGILLGHEMRQMSGIYGETSQIVLVSDPGMRQRFYRRALERFGWRVRAKVTSEQAVCAGLFRVRQML